MNANQQKKNANEWLARRSTKKMQIRQYNKMPRNRKYIRAERLAQKARLKKSKAAHHHRSATRPKKVAKCHLDTGSARTIYSPSDRMTD